jgi:hypothetical protein
MGLNPGILTKKTPKTKQGNDNAETQSTLRIAEEARNRSSAGGLLLRHAVEGAQAEDQVAAGYTNYFATGK